MGEINPERQPKKMARCDKVYRNEGGINLSSGLSKNELMIIENDLTFLAEDFTLKHCLTHRIKHKRSHT